MKGIMRTCETGAPHIIPWKRSGILRVALFVNTRYKPAARTIDPAFIGIII
jgi:hypothetical protein